MAKLMLTSDQVATVLVEQGAKGWAVVTMGAIAVPESGRNAYAVNVNDSPDKPSHRSLDVGLFQINTFWNPTHPIADLLDPAYNTEFAVQILAVAGGPPRATSDGTPTRPACSRADVPEARAAARRLGVAGV